MPANRITDDALMLMIADMWGSDGGPVEVDGRVELQVAPSTRALTAAKYEQSIGATLRQFSTAMVRVAQATATPRRPGGQVPPARHSYHGPPPRHTTHVHLYPDPPAAPEPEDDDELILGPVYAWRLWKVTDTGELRSPQQQYAWPVDGWLDAECTRARGGGWSIVGTAQGPAGHGRMWIAFDPADAEPDGDRPPHDVPVAACTCGIYALDKPLEAVMRGMQATSGDVGVRERLVLGQVELDGRYQHHADGWRAQRARVHALVERRDLHARIGLAAERYGVPVVAPDEGDVAHAANMLAQLARNPMRDLEQQMAATRIGLAADVADKAAEMHASVMRTMRRAFGDDGLYGVTGVQFVQRVPVPAPPDAELAVQVLHDGGGVITVLLHLREQPRPPQVIVDDMPYDRVAQRASQARAVDVSPLGQFGVTVSARERARRAGDRELGRQGASEPAYRRLDPRKRLWRRGKR